MPDNPLRGDLPEDPRADPRASGGGAPPPSRRAARRDSRHAADAAAAETSRRPASITSTAPIDALFEEQGAAAPQIPARNDRDRRKSRIAAWGVFAVILAILGGIAAGGVWAWTTYEDQIRAVLGWEEPKDFEPGLAEGEATVTVLADQTGADISRTLYDAGVTKVSDAFYDYLISTGADTSVLKAGVFQLQRQMTSEAAYEALTDPANRLESTAQLREGLTVAQSVPRIAEGIGLPVEEVEAAVSDPKAYGVDETSLEGWLFPATYTFDPGITAEEVVQQMVDRTIQALDGAGVPEDRREEILTIASIIEKEARYEEDFYRVSRVIQNRLDPAISETGGLLQMDSTAQYYNAEREGGTSSSAAELGDENDWNTYVHPGLPIGPIANPGLTAIKAAMDPADGPWQYFVTINLDTGETIFTETFAEHEREVVKYQQWCRDNPDGGC